MILHVSTFKMSSSECLMCLAKIYTDFLVLRAENLYVILARHNELPEDDILNVETCRIMLFVIIVI